MAGNKFATMVSRNSHKLTLILVYAVLEWILIVLLLLNSLFTYLITKFATYFGLKRPCVWCSRVDHVFESGNSSNPFTDHVCETHANEISKLGYCSNHQRLAETQNMCLDCLAAQPRREEESFGLTRRIAFISWIGNDAVQNGEKVDKCSCCNESLAHDLYPPFSLFKPSWDAMKCAEKGGLVIQPLNDDDEVIKMKELNKLHGLSYYSEDGNEMERNYGEEHHYDDGAVDEHQILSDVGSFGLKDAAEEDCSRSESNEQFDGKESSDDQKIDCQDHVVRHDSISIDFFHRSDDERTNVFCCEEDDSIEIIHLGIEKDVNCGFERLIPVELIDSSTIATRWRNLVEEKDHQVQTSNIGIQVDVLEEVAEDMKQKQQDEIMVMGVDMNYGKKPLSCMNNDSVEEAFDKDDNLLEPQILSTDSNDIEAEQIEEPEKLQEEETFDSKLLVDLAKTGCSAEMSPPAASNEPEAQESTPEKGNNSTEISKTRELLIYDEIDTNFQGKTFAGDMMNSGSLDQDMTGHNVSVHSESNDAEEEKFPETPNSSDSLHYLHKKLLLFEKRESGTEDSLDGSVISEIDAGDPVLTVERLKTALKAERKALSALYRELEEERSASAISANQTMAMINRLQEEKAAMQMEALQYQRMMEEQAEYDQEALQLLNELMVKREKEKQELEKELEVYRQKDLEYEATEKMRLIRRIKDESGRSRNSSASSSVAEDTEELSIDLNREAKEEGGSVTRIEEINNNDALDDDINLEEIALDCVKQMSVLDDSLVEFEEERLSILDQLKALEEKLISLGEKELEEDDQSVGSTSKYNTKGFDQLYELRTPEDNSVSNELSKDVNYPERKSISSMAKNLLPLLDAAENGTEDDLVFDKNVDPEFLGMEDLPILNGKKLAIEDEVDHVYERLQALETDREFLKHCMSSMQNGERGMDLLQEVLQHLRDLRSVELRVRSMNDDPQGGSFIQFP